MPGAIEIAVLEVARLGLFTDGHAEREGHLRLVREVDPKSAAVEVVRPLGASDRFPGDAQSTCKQFSTTRKKLGAPRWRLQHFCAFLCKARNSL